MLDFKKFMDEKKAGTKYRYRSNLIVKPNGRSADFIIPNFATGCPLACTYCCIARHRPFGNSLESYTNLDEIWSAVEKHSKKLGPKVPNQCDPVYWTYDIGEATDCMAPQNHKATLFFLEKFLNSQNAKSTFATKISNHYFLPSLDNPGRARVRLSLMPRETSIILEPGTSDIYSRMEAANALVEKGYEVHLNFSPVVLTTNWKRDYAELFIELNKNLSDKVKQQLKCEVIFLTHHPKLHELNLDWAPDAEKLLWTPDNQEFKTNTRGDSEVVRYKAFTVKREAIAVFKKMLGLALPSCEIRYIF
jgi:DNA repair photolyase